MVWHKISARFLKKPTTVATEKHIFSKTSPSELFEVLSNTPEQRSVPKSTNHQTFKLPYNAGGKKSGLAGELKFFILAVLVSLLFWFTLAIIIEQDIITTEHIYLRERNAFFLTIVFFYFLRLSAWMTNKTDSHEGNNWGIEVPVTRRDNPGRRFVGNAKDEAGKVKDDGGQRAVIKTEVRLKVYDARNGQRPEGIGDR